MSPSDLRRPGVLIVEADEALRTLLIDALAPLGCDVGAARSAAEARRELSRQSWDVVVLDLALPDEDGLSFGRWLCADDTHGTTGLIFLTDGEPDDETLEAMLALGEADFLVRPIRPALFRARLRAQIRLRLRERDLLAELKAQAAQLEERADFQQQLVGIVSHDLRNPIGAIQLGASAMLLRSDLSDGQKVYLQQIVRAADRAARMVRDLLDFTRLRLGGGIPLQPRSADLRTIADQVVRETQSAHPDRRVDLRVEGQTDGVWDADRIAQLISNLLGNAVAYSPRESTVTVRVTGGAEEATLSVHNHGEPIAPQLLPHLFEPLRRGEGGGSNRSIGLGLYIVHNIARAHGGHVEVRSTAEEGTTFTVRLPRQPPSATSKTSGMFSIRALKAAREAARKASA
ncbi:MAG: response regulator [Myxococcaceae bacterium]|nr:response regulator [Myxococcaceae bacterium]